MVVSVGLVVLLARAVRARHTTNPQPYTISSVRDESDQVPAYLLTYVFPFIFLSIANKADLLACLVFAFFLLVLVYRTDLAVVNPLLLTIGYHLYRVSTSHGTEIILLAKRRPAIGETIHAVRIADHTYKLRPAAE